MSRPRERRQKSPQGYGLQLPQTFRFPKTDGELLSRLAEDPHEGEALLILYQNHRKALRKALRLFRDFNRETKKKLMIHILLAVARRAREFNREVMCPNDWIEHCMNAEAQRLRGTADYSVRRRTVIN